MNASVFYRSRNFATSAWQRIPGTIWVAQSRHMATPIGLGLLAAMGYYFGTELGFALTPPQSPISTLWPPNAILLAVFLLSPVRNWWLPILAVLPVHVLIQLRIGIPFATSIGWFIGNVSEALLGAALVHRFADPRRMFESVRGTLVFLCSAVVFAPLATTFVDAGTVILTGVGKHYWAIWTERFLSNALAEIIFVPIIVTFWTGATSWIKNSNPAKYLEASALVVGLLIVSFLAFSTDFQGSPALIYVPLSLLLWAALRFGLAGLSVCVLTVALVSIAGAMHGKGPFVSGSMERNVISLQILLGSVATPLMLLTALTTERQQMRDSLQELAQKLIGAHDEERQRIGRELHDDYSQSLALVAMDIQRLSEFLPKDSNESQQQLSQIETDINEMSLSLHSLSHQLHPTTLEYLGLVEGLTSFCNEFAKQQKMKIPFTQKNVPQEIPKESAFCLYRIVQEGLRNVKRHSGTDTAEVALGRTGVILHLSIADAGKGFDRHARAAGAGIGLTIMEERVRLLGGQFVIQSALGQGTRIEVYLPITLDGND